MKRLKIRGKEIKKLGYTDDNLISLASQLISNNFKREKKIYALELLKDILNNPNKYLNHEKFKQLAEKLTSKNSNKLKPKKATYKKFEIENLKIFGREYIDEQTIDQMKTAMRLPVSIKGALMPDAHLGYGIPIGGVLATYNAIIPYAVGMDIGCRMCLSIYDIPSDYIEKNRDRLKNILLENTRFGKAEFNDINEHEILEREEFKSIKFLMQIKDRAYSQLGSSGGGNHFVDIGFVNLQSAISEIGISEGKYLAVLSHSGSRGFGAEIARHYVRLAKDKRKLGKGSVNLAWLELSEEEGIEYWMAMNLAGDYSAANHSIIHQKISASLGIKPTKTIENHHNFAWKEKLSSTEEIFIHRKGATPANKGKLAVIPGSMATPGFIIKGKGNESSLNSASHGAGRTLSRKAAKMKFNKKELIQKLKKKGIDLIGGDADESPEAYKDIYKIMESQNELVEIIASFHPKIVRMEGNV
ncbi:RtcB family protein [Bacteroidota bacterium]